MKRASEIKGYKLSATDGQIGRVKDFYFDDQHWGIRYLVADTGRWLAGKQVLIAPPAVVRIDYLVSVVEVNLTKGQIESSPSIDEDLPVSREYEVRYYHYYGWPMYGQYWNRPFGGHAPLPAAHPGRFAIPDNNALRQQPGGHRVEDENHLRSFREVSTYRIEANDGDIGHVEDLLLDVEHWAVRYFVVDTRNWWPGKRVLVSPQWVQRINWHDGRVQVDLRRELIKTAPEFDGNADEVSREYEHRLYCHYGKDAYWRDETSEVHA